jgi:hypothetical protein
VSAADAGRSLIILLALLPVGPVQGADPEEEPAMPTVRCSEVRVRAGTAYMAQTSELTVVDVSDLLRPRALGTLGLPATLFGLDLEGPLAFLAAGSHGLYIADVTDPAAPELIQRFDTPGKVRRVEVRGDLAYLADDRYGLRVVDVSNPARPIQRSRTLTRDAVNALALEGDLLALAEGRAGIRLFELDRAGRPRELHLLREAKSARDVLLTESLLLVADGERGLLVYRLGDPPKMLAELELDGTATHIAASADVVLVSVGRKVHVVDITDPESPCEIASVTIHRSFPAGRIHWNGPMAFVAADLAGMAVVDLSDPRAPELLLPRRRPMTVTFPRGSL